MIKGLMIWWEAERFGIVQPGEDKAQEVSRRISSMWINTWICEGKEDEVSRLFSLVPTDRPISNGQNLKHLKFCLNIRKQFYCEGCQSKTTIEIFKSCLDTVLGNLLWLVLLEQMISGGASHPQSVCASVIITQLLDCFEIVLWPSLLESSTLATNYILTEHLKSACKHGICSGWSHPFPDIIVEFHAEISLSSEQHAALQLCNRHVVSQHFAALQKNPHQNLLWFNPSWHQLATCSLPSLMGWERELEG